VTTFMDMILNGGMWRKANHKMNRTLFLCSNFADFWAWSVVLWLKLHQHACLRVTPHSLYLDKCGL